MIRLSITEQGGTTRLVTFESSQVSVGRTQENDLPLPGKGLSGRHARFVRGPQGVLLEDLGSTNGTYVNRHRISSPTPVGPADEIVMAVYTIRVVPEQAASVAAPVVPPASTGPAPAPVPPSAPPVSAPPLSAPPVTTRPGPSTAHMPALQSSEGTPALDHSSSTATPALDPAAAAWTRERDKIDMLTRAWLGSGRDRKHLLRGSKLEHARKWLAQGRHHRPGPKREHQAFIGASNRAARMRLFRRVGIGGLLAGAVGVGGLQLWRALPVDDAVPDDDAKPHSGTAGDPEETPRQTETPEQRREHSDALAAKAQDVLKNDPEQALLLAIEAVRLAPAPTAFAGAAGDAFRAASEQLRGQPLRGHEAPLTDVTFSADARWAITASEDQSARVWDLAGEGRIDSIPLRGHAQAVRLLATSGDRHWLYTAADDGGLMRWNLAESDPATTSTRLPGHEAAITSMACSGDGKTLITGSADGKVRAWDASNEPPSWVALADHEGAVKAVDVDATGVHVVSAGADMLAQLTRLGEDRRPSRRIRLEGHEAGLLDAAVAPDGSWVLTASEDTTARLWDPSKRFPGLTVRVLTGHTAAVRRVEITQDSALAVTVGADRKTLVWNLRSKNPELGATTFELHESDITDLATTGPGEQENRPRPRVLATASADGTAHTLDLEARERALDGVRLEVGDPLEAVAFSPDGRWLLTGARNGTARLWDHQARQPAGASRVGRGHLSQVLALDVNLVGTRMVTAGADGTARLWDLLRSGPLHQVAVLEGHEGRVRAVAFSPDSEFVATAGDDAVVRLWKASVPDPAAGHRALSGHGNVVSELAFTPDGRALVSISADRTVRVWTMSREPEKDVAVLEHGDEVNAMALSDDGRWLFTGTVSKLRLWDLQAQDVPGSGRALKHPHDRDLRAVAISERGTYGASSSEDAVVVLWKFAEGGKPVRLRQHDQPVDAMAFSPDGRWLATGSRDAVIRLYDLSDEHPEDSALEVRGHEGRIGSLRFMTQGGKAWLVSGGYDKTIRLWDLSTPEPEAMTETAVVLRGHDQLISDLDLGPDGSFVASTSYDGTARVWPLTAEGLVALGCRRVGRVLDADTWNEAVGGPYRPACRGD